MTEKEAINIIEDVTWKDSGRHPDYPIAREMAIAALEKQTPKKVICKEYREKWNDYIGLCPICRAEFISAPNYCGYCGQKLDWK